jgi:hypothetical protein
MPITTDKNGFTEASLRTDNSALMYAKIAEYAHDGFQVAMTEEAFDETSGENSWFFDEAACREAATFFIMLADELERLECDMENFIGADVRW